MRKFTLTIAERFVLQPALANMPPTFCPRCGTPVGIGGGGTMQGALKAIKILEMVQLDEGERNLIPPVMVEFGLLPENPKEFKLETADHDWLLNYIETYPNWQPRLPLATMRTKIKEAEEFEL